MAVDDAARLDVGHLRQLAVLDVGIEIDRVLQMGLALGFAGHDRRRIRRPVADVAILVYGAQVVGVLEVAIELVAEVSPGNAFGVERVADGAHARGRNRVDIVVGVNVGISVGAVAEIAGIVVVDEIIMARLAVRLDRLALSKRTTSPTPGWPSSAQLT